MTQETKLSLLEVVNEITQLNGKYLSKLREILGTNGKEALTEDQEKSLADASMKLIQANSKIIESCR